MSSTRSRAEQVFAQFNARREAGEEVDFDALCAEHPDLAEELRQMTWAEPDSPDFSFFHQRLRDSSSFARGGRARAGDRLGDFKLVELLDEGGQGEVWIAEQLTLDRRVALKLIRPERASSKSMAMFAREARAGGRLSHPGIVTVFDHGVSGGHSWIAMELIDGACTLRDSMDELAGSRRLPRGYFRRAGDLVAQVAEALQAAHENHVIHRDIKPRNILITSDDRPKVTDFGLARITDEGAISRTGDFAGTYAYMSPEQVAAKRAGIDHRTDVFSLGVVAYELLSLRRPFEGETSREIAEAILTVEPPDLHRLDPRIPRDLATICRKALAKPRGERYQTMAALAADLRRYLADEPILARAPTPWQVVSRWVRKRPTAVAVTLTAAAAATVLITTTRAAEPIPFTGPDYEHLLVAASDADERSPTFVGQRYLVFDRRTDEASAPRLWIADLSSSLTARPWSPVDEAWWSPAVSADGRWLAYETNARTGGGDEPRSAIVIRRLEESEEGLRWSAAEHVRLEPDEGSVTHVRWSSSSRFLYTHVIGDSNILVLHDVLGSEENVEVLRRSRGALPVQATFSPGDAELVVAGTGGLTTVTLDPSQKFPQVDRPLDCGDYRDPLWLADGSLLFGRLSFREASTRLYRLNGDTPERLREIEAYLIGGYTDLALSPDRSLLAMVARIDSSALFLASPDGGEARELPTRFPAVHPVFTPEGKILHGGDTADRVRLFVLDPETGRDEALEVDVPGIPVPWDELHLDQPAFSQDGQRLVFRAKVDPLNNRCDARSWIVVAAWPLSAGTAFAVEMTDRIAFAHVDDAAERLVWVAADLGPTLFTARLEDGRLVDVRRRRTSAQWPARISGDGNWIAAPTPDYRIEVFDWDETESGLIQGGKSAIPRWLASDPGATQPELAYLHWDPAAPERWAVRSVALSDLANPLELGAVRTPAIDPHIAAFDARSGQVVYTVPRREGGDIWLVRPAATRRSHGQDDR